MALPSRRRRSENGRSEAAVRSLRTKSIRVFTASPCTDSTTSPVRRSARPAGLPRTTFFKSTAPAFSSTSNPSHGASADEARLPLLSNCVSNTSRIVSTGIANPMFSAPIAIALLMPTRRPVMSSNAPPLLPWLIAASVCSSPLYSRGCPSGACTRIERPIAESTPLVTVLAWPCGLPIATTVSPTMRPSERPIDTGCTRAPGSICSCSKARSCCAEWLRMRALSERPSLSLHSTE